MIFIFIIVIFLYKSNDNYSWDFHFFTLRNVLLTKVIRWLRIRAKPKLDNPEIVSGLNYTFKFRKFQTSEQFDNDGNDYFHVISFNNIEIPLDKFTLEVVTTAR